MPAKRLRVLLSFTHDTDHDLEVLTGAVVTGLDGNKAYTTLPVDLPTVKTALADFTASVAAAAQGGRQATSAKNKKRHALIALLRQLALYVQANCNDDMATLLSSGFLAANTSRAQQPLPKPVISSIKQGNSGQLIIKVKAIRNARSYDIRYAPVGTTTPPASWPMQQGLTDSRSMPVSGLTVGTTYTFQVRALGSTGYTDFSDAVNHICV